MFIRSLISKAFFLFLQSFHMSLLLLRVLASLKSKYQLIEFRRLVAMFVNEIDSFNARSAIVNFNRKIRKGTLSKRQLQSLVLNETEESFKCLAQYSRELGDSRAVGYFYLRSHRSFLEMQNSTFGNTYPTFLDPGWTSSIGHLGLLSIFARLKRTSPNQHLSDVIVLNMSSNNDILLNLYRKYLPIVRFDSRIHTYFQKQTKALDVIETEIGSLSLYAAFNYSIEKDQHQKLFDLSADTLDSGFKFLRKYGFKDDDWFVTIHIRETSERNEATASNPQLQSYIPAIKRILNEEGWVIRIGQSSMSEFPSSLLGHPKFIDFSRFTNQDAELRLFFLGACRFMIATESGPKIIPSLFGRPCLATNLPHISHCHDVPGLVIPQRIMDINTKKILNFKESIQTSLAWDTKLRHVNFIRIPNSTETILESTNLFLKGSIASTEAIPSFGEYRGLENNARISPAFMYENPHYME